MLSRLATFNRPSLQIPRMERPLGMAAFARQSRLAHALTVLGALVICLLAYFGTVVAVYGDPSVVATEAAVTAQRVGGLAAGVAVWGYFALAFVRGYGGPVLNAVVYPIVIAVVAPFPARWVLFGPDLAGLADRFIGLFVFEPLLTTALIVVAGLGVFVTILSVWAALIGEDAREDWERTHLPADFYDEFVDVS